MAESLRMTWNDYPQIIHRDAVEVPQMSREVIIPDLQGHICWINWPPQLIFPCGYLVQKLSKAQSVLSGFYRNGETKMSPRCLAKQSGVRWGPIIFDLHVFTSLD